MNNVKAKYIKEGRKIIAPITSADYVYDSSGNPLSSTLHSKVTERVSYITKVDAEYKNEVLYNTPKAFYTHLEADGRQVINTGYYLDGQHDRVEVRFKYIDPSIQQQRIFGSVYGDLSQTLYINIYDCYSWNLSNEYNGWTSTGIPATVSSCYFCIDNEYSRVNFVSFDGTNTNPDCSVYTDNATSFVHTNTATFPMTMFGLKSNDGYTNTYENLAKARIYELKVYKSGVLVRHYLPCKNMLDEAGMYEKIEGKFYGNVYKVDGVSYPFSVGYEMAICEGYGVLEHPNYLENYLYNTEYEFWLNSNVDSGGIYGFAPRFNNNFYSYGMGSSSLSTYSSDIASELYCDKVHYIAQFMFVDKHPRSNQEEFVSAKWFNANSYTQGDTKAVSLVGSNTNRTLLSNRIVAKLNKEFKS